jgi:hypothetical protein
MLELCGETRMNSGIPGWIKQLTAMGDTVTV